MKEPHVELALGYDAAHPAERYGSAGLLGALLRAIKFLGLFFLGALALMNYVLNRSTPMPITWTVPDSINSTLGFGKIYAIGLSSRAARRDELNMVANVANLTLTYVEPAHQERLTESSLPFRSGYGPKLNLAEISCWRSHLDIWQMMLDDGVDTALVIEDDLDFDVRLRQQMLQLRPAFIELQRANGSRIPHQERLYPGDWDVLWLGACYDKEWSNATEGKEYIKYLDPTVAPHKESSFDYLLNVYNIYNENAEKDKKARIIHQANNPMCTVGYALTRRGAARLLFKLSRELRAPVDNEMARFTREMKQFTVLPPIMSQWKVWNGRNSDLRNDGDGKKKFIPSVGASVNIDRQASIRTRLEELLEYKYSM